MFGNSLEGFRWMESFTNFEKAPDLTKRGYRLDRMKLLLQCFDNPQSHGKIIHIAGSKGKGSTAAFAAAILRSAGYSTGTYSSPHISDYRERITVDGEFAPESIYIRNMESIRKLIEGEEYLSLPGGSEPTTFELLTLLAFLVFRDMDCSWIVLETGLGGRLDATNLADPALVLLTPIELEHTDLLGSTLPEIASEKAGIIKKNRPVISSRQKEEVLQVFREKASLMNAPLQYLPDSISRISNGIDGELSEFSVKWLDGRANSGKLRLLGDYQAQNCSLAIKGIHTVLPEISDPVIDSAISGTFLPGRLEIIRDTVPFMIDGAHTRQSVKGTLATFSSVFRKKGILIFGSVAGKDASAMAEVLAGQFEHVIISRPGTFKKSNPAALYEIFSRKDDRTILIEDPVEAERTARKLSEGQLPVLVTGSFYMASEIRKILKNKDNKND